jgi:hypothetical protein
VAICREEVDVSQIQSGAMLYAFGKWAIYGVSRVCGGRTQGGGGLTDAVGARVCVCGRVMWGTCGSTEQRCC